MEKYSVLMPVYEKERPEYLKESIESMLDQTVFPDQFVLVKDGPLTDELEKIIADFVKAHKDLFTIVTLSRNSGLGVALDEGLKHCRNELVARMDSDDISLPNRCERQLKLYGKRPELSIVSGNIGEFENDPEHIIAIRDVPEKQKEIMKRMRRRSAFNHPAVMFRKSEVIRCGGYGTLRRKQDHVLFSHMLHSGCEAYNIQDVVLLFRANKSSVSRKVSSENVRNYILAQKINYKRRECSLFDFLYVCLTQTAAMILPESVTDFFRVLLFRNRRVK